MINFRAKEEMGTSVAFVTGVLALAAILAYVLLVPLPNAKDTQAGQKREQERVVQDVDKMQDQLAEAEKVVAARTWTISAQEIHPAVLSKVSSLARANRVKLIGLRPQRPGEAGELQTISYVLSAEGSYPDVVRFIAAIENPANKLAVNLLQFSSSDGESDRVTATVGLMAFRRDVVVEDEKKPTAKPDVKTQVKPEVKTEVKKNA